MFDQGREKFQRVRPHVLGFVNEHRVAARYDLFRGFPLEIALGCFVVVKLKRPHGEANVGKQSLQNVLDVPKRHPAIPGERSALVFGLPCFLDRVGN